MYTAIKLEIKDKIATITLNRPEFANAFVPESYIDITKALAECGKDPDVGAIVITGAGKNFSAGGDIIKFRKLIDEKIYLEAVGPMKPGLMTLAVRQCPKPVIAMVNGAAAGAGCGLALSCDFRVVTPNSRFIMAFINLGLTGDTGCFIYGAKLMGVARATEYLMTGEPLTGDKAYEYGAATVLAPNDKLEEATIEFAKKMAGRPPIAIKLQKEMINDFFYRDVEGWILREGINMNITSMTEDFDEAVTAFQAKRKPVFKGK